MSSVDTFASAYADVDHHFDGLVDDGRLAGYSVLIERSGELVHEHNYGTANAETGGGWSTDTIARIYSMTKPITSVAALQLIEASALRLDDQVADFIPSFARMAVADGDDRDPLARPITVRHLLTHTSGLTYQLHNPSGDSLAAVCEEWATIPLAFQPGDGFWYGVSTDVLGRVIELASGQTLDAYFDEHLLGPLGMGDTGFDVPDHKRHRSATLYSPDASTGAATSARFDSNPPSGRRYLSGGGGLWGTGRDYTRWCRMLLNGGELDGTRVLSPTSVSSMTSNQLGDDRDIYSVVRDPAWGDDVRYRGFGYGVAIELGAPMATAAQRPPTGSYDWGGAASTVFWCDPSHDEAVIFMTQLLPDAVPIRNDLSRLLGKRWQL